jgi:hypothetical protein
MTLERGMYRLNNLVHLFLDNCMQRSHLLLYRLCQLALNLNTNRLYCKGKLLSPARAQCLGHIH